MADDKADIGPSHVGPLFFEPLPGSEGFPSIIEEMFEAGSFSFLNYHFRVLFFIFLWALARRF